MSSVIKKSQKTFQTIKKRVVFSKGAVKLVDCDIKTSAGKILSRQVIEHPGCVVMIPKTADGKYLLVRQYRFPLRKKIWEFPAGGREKNESFTAAAKRELMEEIAMRPRKLKKLFEFYPTPGISGEKMVMYLAENFTRARMPCDEDEDLEVREFSSPEIDKMIREKKIIDGKTLLGFFYLKINKNP